MHPKVMLIEGDRYLVVEKLRKLKAEWFPQPPTSDEWVEFEVPDKRWHENFMRETLNVMDAELSYVGWEAKPKTVILRELINTKQFRQVLVSMVQAVPEGNMLIVLDTNGVISSDKVSKEDGWKDFRKLCRQNGEAVNVGIPLSELSRDVQLEFLVDTFTHHGKNLSTPVASFMLELCLPERGFIISEVEKICDYAGDTEITKDMVREVAFPMSKEHADYLFYTDFFGGDYRRVMETCNAFIEEGRPIFTIIDKVVKAVRWQLVAAHIMTYNRRDIKESLWRYATPRAAAGILKHMVERAEFPIGAFHTTEESELKDRNKEVVLTDFMHKLIVESLGNVLLKDVLALKPQDPKTALCVHAMERFIVAHDAAVEIRLAKASDKQMIFNSAMRKLCKLYKTT